MPHSIDLYMMRLHVVASPSVTYTLSAQAFNTSKYPIVIRRLLLLVSSILFMVGMYSIGQKYVDAQIKNRILVFSFTYSAEILGQNGERGRKMRVGERYEGRKMEEKKRRKCLQSRRGRVQWTMVPAGQAPCAAAGAKIAKDWPRSRQPSWKIPNSPAIALRVLGSGTSTRTVISRRSHLSTDFRPLL